MAAGKARTFSGFTLIELLVTIAVAVILATVAVPGFQSLVATNRQAADFNEILTGLNYARSEAVKRRQEVTAVITDNGGVWLLEVWHDGDVIREMEARHDRVSVSEKSVEFNSLGRRSSCLDTSGESGVPDANCIIEVGDGPNVIAVNSSGNIEKRPSSP